MSESQKKKDVKTKIVLKIKVSTVVYKTPFFFTVFENRTDGCLITGKNFGDPPKFDDKSFLKTRRTGVL